ncbi:MAG: VPLPA-CTERM sorting domain-containing protein [bacterium]
MKRIVKEETTKWIILLIGLLLLFSAGRAQAAVCYGDAMLDWTSLSITTTGVSLEPLSTDVYAYAHAGNDQLDFDEATDTVVEATVPGATAQGSALDENFYVEASAYPGAGHSAYAYTNVYMEKVYTVAGTGSIEVSIPYVIESGMEMQNPMDTMHLYLGWDFWLEWYDNSGGWLNGIGDGDLITGDDYDPVTGRLEGEMNLLLNIDDMGEGDTIMISGTLLSDAAAETAVPIPASMLLLGSGLLCLVGIRRKSETKIVD